MPASGGVGALVKMPPHEDMPERLRQYVEWGCEDSSRIASRSGTSVGSIGTFLFFYLYVRVGELEALTWADVDLERGFVSVHKSVSRRTSETGTTKTKKKK